MNNLNNNSALLANIVHDFLEIIIDFFPFKNNKIEKARLPAA